MTDSAYQTFDFLGDSKRGGDSPKKYGQEEIGLHIDILCQEYGANFCVGFVDYLFEKYILKNNSENILIDGYALFVPDLYEEFIKRCKEHAFRV